MFLEPTSVGALTAFLAGRRSMVLTGAGISTDSGIPEEARRRYWARSAVGWAAMSGRHPNPSHLAVAELERLGLTTGTVTQNVDGLHRKAGSRALIELHGNLAQVTCLECGTREPRDAFQARLLALNPGFAGLSATILPDGDAALDPSLTSAFRVPTCTVCGGVLKPDVIFFGENVPRPRVEQAGHWLEAADALLVLGSSLEVFSGYRFVKAALAQGKPVAVVNLGPTRADGEATLRIEAPLAEVLPKTAELLAGAREGAQLPARLGPD